MIGDRLRRIFFSKCALAAIGLLGLYLASGFLALPALVKWQIEKQVPEKLGQRISVGALRFNPLSFRLEADDVALSDPRGNLLLGARRLLVDFELRSAIDRAWTFAQARIDEPALHLVLEEDGRHNFSALLERLRALKSGKDEPLPRLVMQHVVLAGGRIAFSDRLLAEPLIARIESLEAEIEALSTLPGQAARYRISARSAAGESLQASGGLVPDPLAASGSVSLQAIQVRSLARGLSRMVALGAPKGQLDLAAKFDLALDHQGAISGIVHDVAVDLASLSISAPGAEQPLAAIETLALQQGSIDLRRREASLGGLRMAKGRLAASRGDDGAIDWDKLLRIPTPPPPARGEPEAWRVAVARAAIRDMGLAYRDASGGRSAKVDALNFETAVSADLGPVGMRVELLAPTLSIGAAAVKNGVQTVDLGGASLVGEKLSLARNQGSPGPSGDGGSAETRIEWLAPKLSVTGARLKNGADGVDVARATVAGGKLSLAQSQGAPRFAGDAARVSIAGLAVRQGTDRLALQDVLFESKALSLSPGAAARRPEGLTARFDGAALRLASAGVGTGASAAELARVASARLAAARLQATISGGPLDVAADGLSAELADTVLRSPADASELLRLAKASLAGASLRLGERTLAIDDFRLSRAKLQARLDAQGQFNWLSLFRAEAQPDAGSGGSASTGAGMATPSAAKPPSPAPPAPWRVTLKSAVVDGLAVDFEDRRESPSLRLGLEDVGAQIADLDTASAMKIAIRGKLASGGRIEASGRVRADNGKANLNVRLAGVALAPLQSYLTRFADLRIAGGTVSAAGRLRYGDESAAGARLEYRGGIGIDQVLIEEAEPRRPFLAWHAIATDDMLLTLWPNRLDIGELRLEQPSGRLVIGEDQTVNLADVLKRPDVPAAAGGDGRGDAASPQQRPAGDPFPVSIARVRVSGGALEFSDLSLRPQFRVRMHELQGVVTGLGSDPVHRSQLQLDARVDQYGSAKIRGRMNMLRPSQFTEVDMGFRNLNMTSLSPYVAKFAGYRIASGRLTVDLQYRIRNSKLVGENKLVLNQVKLGEKVDSPHAVDLPLELAIAILQDSDGVIDVELPVSGDLNDPKFDYGAIIGRALGSLLGGIVTAPFRALATLFGGDEPKLGAIDFEPGSDALAPPERQKLATVARALRERPGLVLDVPPTYDAREDMAALKSLALRREIVTRMGIGLSPGEDPGPLDSGNPRTREAIAAAFNARYAPEVFEALKRRAEEGRQAEAVASGPPTRPDPLSALYQALLGRLIDETPISAEALEQLAARRGQAIRAELTNVGGVAAARVRIGELRTESTGQRDAVALQLGLEVAK